MAKRITLLVVGLVMLVAGYFLSQKGLHAPSAATIQDLQTLCDNSVQTVARLDSNYTMRSTKRSKNTYPTREFDLVYHYAANGEEYDGTMTLDSLPTAKSISVWYALSNPQVHVREEPCARLRAEGTTVPRWSFVGYSHGDRRLFHGL